MNGKGSRNRTSDYKRYRDNYDKWKEMEKNTSNKLIVYKCDVCGYIISEIQYNSVFCDVGCPKCKNSLIRFKKVVING